MHRVST